MKFTETIPMRLRCAYLTLHRTAQAHFSQFHITTDQYVLLSVLADESGLTQTELGERMSSDPNTVTAMLRLLEEKELLYRKKCRNDARARRVHLSAKGKRLQKKLIQSSTQLHTILDQAMSASERKVFMKVLETISHHFKS